MPVEDILEHLSARIRHYSLARTVDDLWLEETNRTEVGSLIEALLADHLRSSNDWDAHAWVQGLVLRSLDVSEAGVALWSGMAIWHGHEGWFIDPLSARFALSPDRTTIEDYLIQFGDADIGLGMIRYEPSAKPRLAAAPVQWRFIFPRRR